MSQCWRVLRDTKVCSESVSESLEGHKGVQCQSQCWRALRDTKVCSVSVLESLEGHKGVQ